jgi:hypothetical protein
VPSLSVRTDKIPAFGQEKMALSVRILLTSRAPSGMPICKCRGRPSAVVRWARYGAALRAGPSGPQRAYREILTPVRRPDRRLDEDATSRTGRYERELSTICAISTKLMVGFTP